MDRRIWTLGLFLLIATALVASNSQAEMQVKFASVVGIAGSPGDEVAKHMTKRLDELTNHEMKIKFFPQAQLGGDRELLEGVMTNTIEMAFIATTPMAMTLKEIGVLDLPYLVDNLEQFWKICDGPFLGFLNDKALRKGFRIIGVGLAGSTHIMTRKNAVNGIKGVKGLKIRTMQAPLHIQLINSYGAIATPVPWPEVYMALSQGVVDGTFTALIPSVQAKHYEQNRYFALSQEAIIGRALVVSEQWFQSLPEKNKLHVLIAGREGVVLLRKLITAHHGELVKFLKSEGVTITHPNMKEFKDAFQKAYPKCVEIVGGKDLINYVQSLK